MPTRVATDAISPPPPPITPVTQTDPVTYNDNLAASCWCMWTELKGVKLENPDDTAGY